nr:mannitol dehydrogenase family protein [Afifella sp. IM 167]
MGVGNFHRAHQAFYTQKANAAAGEAWRITGVSLRRPDTRDALAPQGFRYTVEINAPDETRYETISVLDDILVASEDPSSVVAAIADPRTALVTLTVTEKGYHLRPSDRRLDLDDPKIAADMTAEVPTTTIGILAEGLARRMAEGAGPLTVLSCDNLPENGAVLEAAILAFAGERRAGLGQWIATHAAFPSSMVDRIVPATSEELKARVRQATGQNDAWPVATEDFSEWVIEDRFAGPRPLWEMAGARLVPDVRPYEMRKLRMLNGAHSALAYAGTLAGKTFVHEAIADEDLAGLARAVMTESGETLPEEVRVASGEYAEALIKRFSNGALNHRLRQIAMDGSQKLPARLVAPLNERVGKGLESPGLERAIASWIAFLGRDFRDGEPVDDPLAERLKAHWSSADGFVSFARAVLTEPAVFSDLAARRPEVAERLAAHAEAIFAA